MNKPKTNNIMANKELTKEELDQLNEQYFKLTETLKDYRSNMKKRDYRKRFDQFKRNQIETQFNFFKSALNETLLTLMAQDGLKAVTGFDAIVNRFVRFVNKWKIGQYLRDISKKHMI